MLILDPEFLVRIVSSGYILWDAWFAAVSITENLGKKASVFTDFCGH